MISFILGILTTLIAQQLLKPKAMVVYGNEALEFLGYDSMSSQFSFVVDDVRCAWDVEKLWVKFETLEPVEWEIPESFKDDWNWGQSHPSDHIERCLNANLDYPILVWEDDIIDGCHRTIKALAQGQKTIKARVIIDLPPPDEKTEPKSDESNTDITWTNRDMVLLVQAIREYEEMKEYDFRHPLDP
jgi:hypothetical protein